jgi:hypothetical protein
MEQCYHKEKHAVHYTKNSYTTYTEVFSVSRNSTAKNEMYIFLTNSDRVKQCLSFTQKTKY